MLLKKSVYKTTAMALAVISIFGSSLTNISAYDGVDKNVQPISQYADGVYELNTKLKNASDENKDSMANGYLQSSKLEIKDGKQYMVLVFTSGSMIKEAIPSVDGVEVSAENNLNGDIRTVKFEVPSIDSNIKLKLKINPFGDMVIPATCIVKSEFKVEPPVKPEPPTEPETPELPVKPEPPTEPETPELPVKPEPPTEPETPELPVKPEPPTEPETPELPVKPEPPTEPETPELPVKPEQPTEPETPEPPVKPEQPTEPEISESPVKPETSEAPGNSIEYKNGFYELKNTVKCDNPTGYAMVRNLLNENTVMEVKDGKIYISFEMSGYDMMGDVKIKVNGKSANFTKVKINDKNVKFKLEVPNLDAYIDMNMYVKPMSQNVEFGIGLNKNTVKFVSSNEEPTITEKPSHNNSSGNTNSNSGGSTNNQNNSTGTTAVKGKLYTIKNEIIEDNTTGKEMARKYLNETSKIEEENGKTYATLTFTGVDLMKDHKIYVNGKRVNHQVVSKDSKSISIRFEIPNVDADIKVELFVIPMNSNIDFGVKLLKDTLTFVKNYEANAKLPQTGSVINSDTMMFAGSIATLGGLTIGRKKRK